MPSLLWHRLAPVPRPASSLQHRRSQHRWLFDLATIPCLSVPRACDTSLSREARPLYTLSFPSVSIARPLFLAPSIFSSPSLAQSLLSLDHVSAWIFSWDTYFVYDAPIPHTFRAHPLAGLWRLSDGYQVTETGSASRREDALGDRLPRLVSNVFTAKHPALRDLTCVLHPR